jgi:hypothetical protein
MSINPTTQHHRPRTAKFALASSVVLGLIAAPLTLAAPANAETSERGCTVDPLKPKPSSKSHWDTNEVDFRIRVECNGNKTVQIRQLRFEDDPGRKDTFLGRSTFLESFDRHDRSVTLHSRHDVPNADRHGDEEVYQLVSFRVRSGHSDNWSDWTDWEKSDIAEVDD